MKSYQVIVFVWLAPFAVFIVAWGAFDLQIPRVSAIIVTCVVGCIAGIIAGYFLRVKHEEQAAVRQAKWRDWVDEVCPPLPPKDAHP